MFWPVAAVLIIAAFFRLYQLTQIPPGLYPDEAMNGNNALEALRTGDYKVYYPENNGREGLFINIQAQFLRFLMPARNNQPQPWMLRLPSAIFGALTVWGIYFLGRELLSPPAGLAASFLLATSFWHINFSRIGFRAIMAPLLMCWGGYLLIYALRRLPPASQKIYAAAAIGGVVFGLGFHTYIAYRIMALLLLVIWYFYRRKPGFWRVALVFLGSAIIAGLPIAIYYLQHPGDFFGRTVQISIFNEKQPLRQLGINTLKTVGMFFWAGDYNWRHNLAGQPELFLPVAILFLAGIILGLRKITSSRYDSPAIGFGILFSWLILALLPVVISAEGLPHALRSILLLPPAMLIAAAGGVHLYEKLNAAGKSSLAKWSTITLAVILLVQAYVAYFVVWAKNPNTAAAFSADYVYLGQKLNSLPADVPKYVIVEASGVEVRGIPMPAQTVMFITDTFSPENQRTKNIYYRLPNQKNEISPDAERFYLR